MAQSDKGLRWVAISQLGRRNVEATREAGKGPEPSGREEIPSEHAEGQRGIGSVPVMSRSCSARGEGDAGIHPHQIALDQHRAVDSGFGRRMLCLPHGEPRRVETALPRPWRRDRASLWLPGREGDTGSVSGRGPFMP